VTKIDAKAVAQWLWELGKIAMIEDFRRHFELELKDVYGDEE
jgi:hypothetical protein